ncbi:hypothetical protein PC116_g26735 [Phytophthora cactorum]|uniref:Uncharacterized protein n=1 Tax=Phytophthora cactorum TaxID=29920 RepID=A0A8T1JJC8_9STRA|nr:hypothetical protein Pcac1_g7201 [Phytophthora cactorum]KAG2873323.1 hypothetical protein PC114_g25922 [Phytophthora cactorum]KAG2878529.1 hypothetical protein PC115_g23038 [Phytophthora cactorum]KAG2884783.1 hypothetical protein PC117_g25737 [Phytophthora cactorum]KAG2970288.1 hypothetical protein PC119_g23678 [Phytophthora cactorum]
MADTTFEDCLTLSVEKMNEEMIVSVNPDPKPVMFNCPLCRQKTSVSGEILLHNRLARLFICSK